jgi:hypothetical protein
MLRHVTCWAGSPGRPPFLPPREKKVRFAAELLSCPKPIVLLFICCLMPGRSPGNKRDTTNWFIDEFPCNYIIVGDVLNFNVNFNVKSILKGKIHMRNKTHTHTHS